MEKVESQWTTLESGPLARLESLEKAEIVEKVESQWTTFSSGPLAGPESLEKGRKRGKSHEPVVHFAEWTTGWSGKPKKGRKPRPLARKKAP